MSRLEFEWDPAKSAANLRNHGIDFESAKQLWDDPNAITGPAMVTPEPRFMTVARLSDKTWSAVHTYRNGRIRLISVGRSRFDETAAYEAAIDAKTRQG